MPVRKTKQLKHSQIAPEPETFRVIVSSRGQVVIPATIRRRCGLNPKTRVIVSEQKGRITLTPVHVLIDELRGSFKGTGIMQEFLEERARERELEDTKFERLFGKARKRS